jgi:hypothetical protein
MNPRCDGTQHVFINSRLCVCGGTVDEFSRNPDESTPRADHIPLSVWQGTIRLFGVDLNVHVLDNGQRIIEQESVAAFFAALGGLEDPDESDAVIEAEMMSFAKFVRGRGIPQ